MDKSVRTQGAFGSLAGLLVCAAVALLTGRLLSESAGWLVVFAPSAIVGFLCLLRLLKTSGVPVTPLGHDRAGETRDFGSRRHPNEGLINPATGLFITGAGVDMSGNGYGMGSRDRR